MTQIKDLPLQSGSPDGTEKLVFQEADSSTVYNTVQALIDALGVTGATGAAGADGAVIRFGTGVPSNALGQDNDLYVETDNAGLIYLKAGGSYSTTGFNMKGDTGDTGATGATGATGPAGADGAEDALINFQFDSDTVMNQPSSGDFKLNNSDPSLVTAIALSLDSANSPSLDCDPWFTSWDDSTSTVKGFLLLKQVTTSPAIALYQVNGLTDNSIWIELDVTYVTHTSTFSVGRNVALHFSRTGDKGDTINYITTNTTINVAASGGDYTTVGAAYDSLAESVTVGDAVVTIDVGTGTFVESTIAFNNRNVNVKIVGNGSSNTTLSFSADASTGIQAIDGQFGSFEALTLLSTSTSQKAVFADAGIIDIGSDVVIDGWGVGLRATRNGTVMCASGITVSDTTNEGISALNEGHISASGATIDQPSVNGGIGVFASKGGSVIIESGTITGASRTEECILADRIGRIYANGTATDGGTYGIRTIGAFVEMSSGSIDDASADAVFADQGSVVVIDSIGITQTSVNGVSGINADNGSRVYAQGASVQGASRTGSCVNVIGGSYVEVNNADLDDGVVVISVGRGSVVDAQGANIDGATGNNVLVNDHSMAYLQSATITNAGAFGIACNRSSHARANSATMSGNTSGDYSPAVGADGNDNSRIVT